MDAEREQQLRIGFSQSEIMKLFKAEPVRISIGYFEISVSKQRFMIRPAGMFNGSTIAVMVDVASGYAAASAKPVDCYFTTVEMKINYLSPAIGYGLSAKAQVIKSGKRLSVVRTDIYALRNANAHLVATSLVTLMVLTDRKTDLQVD